MPENKKRNRDYDKSPKGIAYRNQYTRDHYSRISVITSPDVAKQITDRAEAEGISKNQLINQAIMAYLEKETE